MKKVNDHSTYDDIDEDDDDDDVEDDSDSSHTYVIGFKLSLVCCRIVTNF